MSINALSTLVVVMLIAAAAPLIASRIPRQLVPVIVIELSFGFLAGPSGLGLIGSNPELSLLAEIGFAFLMFIAGIEIDLRLLLGTTEGANSSQPRSAEIGSRAAGISPLAVAFLMMGGTITIAAVSASLLMGSGRPVSHLLILAFVMSTTSVGIVVPTLKDLDLTRSSYGQTILSAAMLADFVTMLGVSALAAVATSGRPVSAMGSVGFVLIAALLCWGASRFASLTRLRAVGSPTARFQTRFAVLLLFLMGLLAHGMGTELVLAAFLAGLIVGRLEPVSSPARQDIETIGFGVLITFFFVNVGVRFDLSALAASESALKLLPTLIVLVYINKLVPALLMVPRFGLRRAIAGGSLLSARLSLIIATSAIALDLGVFDGDTNAAMILVAVVTAIVSPILFTALYRRG